MTEFRLQIYTQEKMAFDGAVVSIIAPGAEGYVGVWANHAPLVALLGEGKFWLKTQSNEEQSYHVTGGFLEVRDNVATVLVDKMEPLAA